MSGCECKPDRAQPSKKGVADELRFYDFSGGFRGVFIFEFRPGCSAEDRSQNASPGRRAPQFEWDMAYDERPRPQATRRRHRRNAQRWIEDRNVCAAWG